MTTLNQCKWLLRRRKVKRFKRTLDTLVNEYISHPLEIPPSVEMPKINGAETIKVGITGDLPTLDLVLADGTPAGFNTVVLAEISRRINKNIELVQINSGARAAALTSELVDVINRAVRPLALARGLTAHIVL